IGGVGDLGVFGFSGEIGGESKRWVAPIGKVGGTDWKNDLKVGTIEGWCELDESLGGLGLLGFVGRMDGVAVGRGGGPRGGGHCQGN
ncbi:MAG: hypothetical protein ACK44Q_18010, partial [Pirellulaceae bacterium]